MTRFHHDNQETSCNKFAGGEIPAHTRAGSLSDRQASKQVDCMHAHRNANEGRVCMRVKVIILQLLVLQGP